jgi:hypothetical protein
LRYADCPLTLHYFRRLSASATMPLSIIFFISRFRRRRSFFRHIAIAIMPLLPLLMLAAADAARAAARATHVAGMRR